MWSLKFENCTCYRSFWSKMPYLTNRDYLSTNGKRYKLGWFINCETNSLLLSSRCGSSRTSKKPSITWHCFSCFSCFSSWLKHLRISADTNDWHGFSPFSFATKVIKWIGGGTGLVGLIGMGCEPRQAFISQDLTWERKRNWHILLSNSNEHRRHEWAQKAFIQTSHSTFSTHV